MEDSKDSQDIRHTRFQSHVLIKTFVKNLLERPNVAVMVVGESLTFQSLPMQNISNTQYSFTWKRDIFCHSGWQESI